MWVIFVVLSAPARELRAAPAMVAKQPVLVAPKPATPARATERVRLAVSAGAFTDGAWGYAVTLRASPRVWRWLYADVAVGFAHTSTRRAEAFAGFGRGEVITSRWLVPLTLGLVADFAPRHWPVRPRVGLAAALLASRDDTTLYSTQTLSLHWRPGAAGVLGADIQLNNVLSLFVEAQCIVAAPVVARTVSGLSLSVDGVARVWMGAGLAARI